MVNNLHVLEPYSKEVRDSVVEVLKEALERAESGQIVGLALATVLRDRSAASTWSATEHWPSLL